MFSPIIIIGVLAFLVVVILLLGLVSRYRVPGAEEAFIITGTGKGKTGKVYRGTGTFVLPVVQKSRRVVLQSINADLNTNTPAGDGIELSVTAVATVKIGNDEESILKAGERFGDDLKKIGDFVTKQLSGELRAIVGTMTAKAILNNRKDLINKVAEAITPALFQQGLLLDNLTINEVKDTGNTYFANLAAEETSKQEAIAASARSAAKRESEQARILNEQAVISQQRELDIQREEARKITDKTRAEADAVQPLVAAERQEVQLAKDNEVAAQQAKLRETQLDAEIRRPAAAKLYEAQQEAEAIKAAQIAQAEAEAEAIKIKGQAEAEALNLRADALARLDEVGKLELVLNKLPAIISASSEPLANAKITLVGDSVSPLTKTVGNNLAAILDVVKSSTGVDLGKTLKGLEDSTPTE